MGRFRRLTRWTATVAVIGISLGLVQAQYRRASNKRAATGSEVGDEAGADGQLLAQTGPRGHEAKDASVRGIVLTGIGLAAGIGLVLLASGWVVGLFTTGAPRAQVSQARMPSELPPPPRLQVNPAQDWQTLRARDEAWLNGYGWVDRKAQTVHIPIQRAMDLIVQRGLPGRGQAQAAGQAESGGRSGP
jgi:hypothetical protein